MRQRDGLGASLSSVDALHGRLLGLQRALGPDPPPLYFVKVDVRACFDTIKQSYLRDLVASMLQDVRRCSPRVADSAEPLGDRALHSHGPDDERGADQSLSYRGSAQLRPALLRPARGQDRQSLSQHGPGRSGTAAVDHGQGLPRDRSLGHRRACDQGAPGGLRSRWLGSSAASSTARPRASRKAPVCPRSCASASAVDAPMLTRAARTTPLSKPTDSRS